MNWLLQVVRDQVPGRVHGYRTKKDAEAVMQRYTKLSAAGGLISYRVRYTESGKAAVMFKPNLFEKYDRVILLRKAQVRSSCSPSGSVVDLEETDRLIEREGVV